MRKTALYILLLFSLVCMAGPEKKEKEKAPTPIKSLLKDARAAIKNKKDQAKNEQTLEQALKRKDVTNEEISDIRHTQALLNISLNDAENLKAYLKQKYDTAAYFNTLLKASQYAIKCDSTDTLPNAKGKVRNEYRVRNREILLKYRPNLYAGGRFFLRKNDYKTALPFFRTYVDMINEPCIAQTKTLPADTLLNRAFFYAAVAAYNSNQPKQALLYIDNAIAEADSIQKPNLQEYKVRSLLATGDTVAWKDELMVGCMMYSKHDFFFQTLEEMYEEQRQYDRGIELADSMLHHVQDIPLYWHVKSIMYLDKQDWDKCIEMCDSTLRRDSVHTQALYNKGISYVNRAAILAENACYDLKNPRCRKERQRIKELYNAARGPFEQYKALLPDDKKRWVPSLYRIYLNLNLGKEFNEMEKLMKELESK